MALKINAELNGLIIPEGYCKVENVSYFANTDRVSFTIALYANEQARRDGKRPIERNFYSNSFNTENKTGNLIQQAYEYIKSLAEYEGEDGQRYAEHDIFGQAVDV